MTAKPLYALGYLGGKAHGASGSHSCGSWLASLLPWERDSTYCEPFAGMLGVLLQRAPVKWEIVNDADDRLVTWWRVLQDDTQREQLVRRLTMTPRARSEYVRAQETVNGGTTDAVDTAWAVTVMLTQGVRTSLGDHGQSSWRRCFMNATYMDMAGYGERLAGIAERMSKVQIDCGDACELIERTADIASSVLYVDPPYPSAKSGDVYAHGASALDLPRLTAALGDHRGRVLISGYGTEWDALGWARHERRTHSTNAVGETGYRTEVAWANFDITEHQNTIEQGVLL